VATLSVRSGVTVANARFEARTDTTCHRDTNAAFSLIAAREGWRDKGIVGAFCWNRVRSVKAIIDSCKQATTPIWIPKLRLLLARPQGRNHQACFLSQPGESTDRHSLFDFRCADFAGPNALLTFKVLIAK